VNPLFARLGVPADTDTLAGIKRLVSQRTSESRHLDFKQQIHNVDDLADDLCAIANIGGGVLIVGVGTDKSDCAASLHEQVLHVVEQKAVQAAREGIDEPLHVEPMTVPGSTDPATGFLVVAVPPSDRIPHITVKRGRVLHRVGTHNKPMTRRELGAAFAAGGDLFAVEFGLMRGYGGAAITCEVVNHYDRMYRIKIANAGSLPARNVSLKASTEVLWAADDGKIHSATDDPWAPGDPAYVADPPYLPVRSLPPGSDVVLECQREQNAPKQDVLEVTWETPDGQLHRNAQSWTWSLR
jgi:hypothetical protein